jgi:IS605 OrfB family transposase
MPTTSIELRAFDPGKKVSKALTDAHRMFNDSVNFFSSLLLLMRGEPYFDQSGIRVEVAQITKDLLGHLPQAARAPQLTAQIQSEFKKVFAHIVKLPAPSAANRFHCDLFTTTFMAKTKPTLPQTMTWSTIKDAKARLQAADAWAQAATNQQFLKPKTKATAWIKLRQSGDHSQRLRWPAAYVKWTETHADDASIDAINTLRSLGALPLVVPDCADLGDVKWNRGAFRQAIEAIKGWSACDDLVKDRYADLGKAWVDHRAEHPPTVNDSILRDYEKERFVSIKKITKKSLRRQARPFKIGLNTVRFWDVVRARLDEVIEKADKAGNPVTRDDLVATVKGAQASLGKRKRLGDCNLFCYLADPAKAVVWDRVIDYAWENDLNRRIHETKRDAAYSAPHYASHPKWLQYEGLRSSNLNNYTLISTDQGQLIIKIKLPPKAGYDGEIALNLMPSRQCRTPIVTEEEVKKTEDCVEPEQTSSKKRKARKVFDYHLDYTSGSDGGRLRSKSGRKHGQDRKVSARVGGVFIRFDRDYLTRNETKFKSGRPGPIRVKLTLDVNVNPSDQRFSRNGLAWIDNLGDFGKTSKMEPGEWPKLPEGLRTMSVDLGQRYAAATAMYEIVHRPQLGIEDPDSIQLPDQSVYAKALDMRKMGHPHIIKLDGEDPSHQTLALRSAVFEELFDLRSEFYENRSLLRAAETTDQATRLLQVPTLKGFENSDAGVWATEVLNRWRAADKILSAKVKVWRKKLRQIVTNPRAIDYVRGRNYHGGISMWHIDFLSQVHRFLKSWSHRARRPGEINRQNRKKSGEFGARLSARIRNLKKTRVGEVARAIINQARGAGCALILIEDLGEYKATKANMRSNNRRLMNWAQRSIVKKLEELAKLYAIRIHTVSPDYTSRFYYKNGAPGIRCLKITESNINREYLIERARKLGLFPLKENDLLPDDGGNIFVSMAAGQLKYTQADINAARSLAHRFFTRYTRLYKLYLTRTDGGWLFDPDSAKSTTSKLGDVGAPDKKRSGPSRNEVAAKKTGISKKTIFLETSNGTYHHGEHISDVVAANTKKDKGVIIFRDPSGAVFRSTTWFPKKTFWSRVQNEILDEMKSAKKISNLIPILSVSELSESV